MFTMDNCRPETLVVQSLTPVHGKRVRVQAEYTMPGVLEDGETRRACERLRTLLVEYVTECFDTQTKRRRPSDEGRVSEWVNAVVADVALLLTLPVLMLVSLYRAVAGAVGDPAAVRKRRASQLRAEALVPSIRTPREGVRVGQEILKRFPAADSPSPLAAACQDAVKHLGSVESVRASATEAIASIGPDGSYSRPFVLEARRRRALRWQQVVVAVEARFSGQGPSSTGETSDEVPVPTVENAHTVLTFSPSPLMVTLFAMLGAASAVAVKVLPGVPGQRGPARWDPADLGSWLLSGHWLEEFAPSVILAAVVFNIIDLTPLEQKYARLLDWRGALFIGFACGISSLPVMRALGEVFSK